MPPQGNTETENVRDRDRESERVTGRKREDFSFPSRRSARAFLGLQGDKSTETFFAFGHAHVDTHGFLLFRGACVLSGVRFPGEAGGGVAGDEKLRERLCREGKRTFSPGETGLCELRVTGCWYSGDDSLYKGPVARGCRTHLVKWIQGRGAGGAQ